MQHVSGTRVGYDDNPGFLQVDAKRKEASTYLGGITRTWVIAVLALTDGRVRFAVATEALLQREGELQRR